jgi:hypothetical protein
MNCSSSREAVVSGADPYLDIVGEQKPTKWRFLAPSVLGKWTDSSARSAPLNQRPVADKTPVIGANR